MFINIASHVDESLRQFVTLFHGVIDLIAPHRDVKVKQKTEPWFNSHILSGIRRRDSLFRKWRKDRSNDSIHKEYCSVRNRVQRDIKKAKEFYFRDQIVRNQGNSSKLWSHLKSLGYGKNSKSNADIVLNTDGKDIFDRKSVADTFNGYFTSIASKLVELLPAPFGLFTGPTFRYFYESKGIFPQSFFLSPVSSRDILDQLRGLKIGKSVGLDDISPGFLKDGASIIAGPIARIINLSITSETVPSSFKDARVSPIFKKGGRLDPGKYQPVSVLNVLSKILKRTVHR